LDGTEAEGWIWWQTGLQGVFRQQSGEYMLMSDLKLRLVAAEHFPATQKVWKLFSERSERSYYEQRRYR
jgi:hypothetical protein